MKMMLGFVFMMSSTMMSMMGLMSMTMMTNHNDEVSCEDASRRSDHGHNKAVEESKKIT